MLSVKKQIQTKVDPPDWWGEGNADAVITDSFHQQLLVHGVMKLCIRKDVFYGSRKYTNTITMKNVLKTPRTIFSQF
ncbi:hypothetical protein [Ruminococcus albus]|uniref:hypothetical protein n=1 Tax=Ruminococcus albus TaxID=1264 RepID=UPI000466D71A|nr:hypothetical protein [Ruminococcus albus]